MTATTATKAQAKFGDQRRDRHRRDFGGQRPGPSPSARGDRSRLLLDVLRELAYQGSEDVP
jgi:hypothetical protein